MISITDIQPHEISRRPDIGLARFTKAFIYAYAATAALIAADSLFATEHSVQARIVSAVFVPASSGALPLLGAQDHWHLVLAVPQGILSGNIDGSFDRPPDTARPLRVSYSVSGVWRDLSLNSIAPAA